MKKFFTFGVIRTVAFAVLLSSFCMSCKQTVKVIKEPYEVNTNANRIKILVIGEHLTKEKVSFWVEKGAVGSEVKKEAEKLITFTSGYELASWKLNQQNGADISDKEKFTDDSILFAVAKKIDEPQNTYVTIRIKQVEHTTVSEPEFTVEARSSWLNIKETAINRLNVEIGYELIGWKLRTEDSVFINDSYTFESNTDIYPVVRQQGSPQLKKFTLSIFGDSNITVKRQTLTVEEGTKWSKVKQAATDSIECAEGYECIAWKIDNQSGAVLTDDHEFTADTKLFAEEKKIPVPPAEMITITVQGDVGIEVKKDSIEVKKNSVWADIKTAVASCAVCKQYYEFVQWKLTNGTGIEITNETSFMEDVTVFAVSKRKTVTVSIAGNDKVTVNTSSLTIECGSLWSEVKSRIEACISIENDLSSSWLLNDENGTSITDNYCFDSDRAVFVKAFDTGIFRLDNSGAIIGYTCQPKNLPAHLVIPEKIGEKTITTIKSDVFANCDKIKSVSFPKTMSMVEQNAFKNCRELQAVEFADGGTQCAYNTFDQCNKLSKVTILGGVVKHHLCYAFSSYRQLHISEIVLCEGVTKIESSAFYNFSDITKISIPATVTDISQYAFKNCENLKTVELKKYPTTIGNPVFYNCNQITELRILSGDITFPCSSILVNQNSLENKISQLYLGEEVTSICSNAFSGCIQLTGLDIAHCKKLTSIPASAFSNCTSLEVLKLPASLEFIDNSAFSSCSGIAELNITHCENLKSINSSSFANCSNLKTVQLPKSIETIGNSAFLGCYQIEQVDLSPYSKLTKIEDRVFSGCSALRSITLPDSLERIGNAAFNDCYALTAVQFPKNLEQIGDSAFSNCYALTAVQLPNNLLEIGRSAFYNCSAITGITFGQKLRTIQDNAFEKCRGIRGALNMLACTNLTEIGGSAFLDCSAVTEIKLPASLQTLKDKSFANCIALKKVVLGNGAITHTTGTSGSFLKCKSIKELTILSGKVTFKVKDMLADSYKTMSSVVFGEDVTEIGSTAFSECLGIKGVLDLSQCDKLTSIGYSAFYGCSKLLGVRLPKNLTKIDSSAFSGCSGLSGVLDMSACNKLVSLGSSAFYDCSNISGIKFPKNIKTIGSSCFANCYNIAGTVDMSGCTELQKIENSIFSSDKKIQTVKLPPNITEIADSAFLKCSGLTEIKLPESLTKIGNKAFGECTALAAVEFGKGDILIATGNDASFYNDRDITKLSVLKGNINFKCSDVFPHSYQKIKTLILGEGITGIGASAFSSCNGIEGTLNLGNCRALTAIGNQAFNSCYGITGVQFPASLQTLGELAFNGCNGINTMIDFSQCTSMQSIGKSAFYNCKKITGVKFPNSLKSIGSSAFCQCVELEGMVDLSSCLDLKIIDEKLFQGCGLISGLKLPKTISEIKSSAFENCKKIDAIDLSACADLTTIGVQAFKSCTEAVITLHVKVSSVGTAGFGNSNDSYCKKVRIPRGADGDNLKYRVKNSGYTEARIERY
nr:leucine-rich repeat domain-containing protein [Treponema denticola]